MKKLLTLLFASSFLYAGAQNIPNREFEDWFLDTLYENTGEWHTSLDDFYSPEILTVEKSTDAQDGNYSILLSNDTIEGDTTFGYAVQGFLDDGPDSDPLIYTSDIDSITGWYKCDMGAGDSAVVIVFQYSDTDTTNDAFTIGGTQNSWTRFSFPLQDLGDTLTEIFVGFVSTDPDIIGTSVFHPESWIMFDNIEFTHASLTPALIPDNSFEDWYAEDYEDIEDWVTFNWFSTILGEDLQVEKTTDAYSGDYAMKITSYYTEAFDDTVGLAATSEIGDKLPGGFAFNEVPLSISGYYKYLPAEPWDTAALAVILTNWNGDSTEEVLLEVFQLTEETNYTHFSFDLDTAGLDTTMFDSVNIVFVSSQYVFDGGAPEGSELYIDDIWLDSKCAFADTSELWDIEDTLLEIAYSGLPSTDYSFEGPAGYSTYTWSEGVNSVDDINVVHIQFDGSNKDTLSLIVLDSNNCRIEDMIIVEIQFLESTLDKLLNEISIYPNPTSSTINIDLTQTEQSLEKEITILDLSGNKIMSTFVNSSNKQIDISNLSSGAYFMNIRIGEELMTYKVIKK